MSLKSIKDELAALQADEQPITEDETLLCDGDTFKDPVLVNHIDEPVSNIRLVSPNGIAYSDPRPARYCSEFQFLVKPTMTDCNGCGSAWSVDKLSTEEWIWYLDPETGVVEEHGDENSIPVTAFLKVANVTRRNKGRIVMVYDRFKGATACPRRVHCEP